MQEFSMRSVLSMVLFGSLVAVSAASGCVGMEEMAAESGAELGKNSGPMLNLSHIACADDGTVTVHFVLLFAGSGTPGTLTGTYNGGSFSATPSKSSGNVWHYNVSLPPGEIDILSAQVTTSNGTVVTLHNPSEYSGNYACGPEDPACAVVVEPVDVYCTDAPLGNPGKECANFGLEYTGGKDDGLTGTTFVATTDAYVAIVKSGTAGCEPGQSAYRIYVNVSAGDVLSTPVDQNISHVTYCECPAAQ
jgi:hypothetical protein